jgi:hypothetical protein
MKHPQRRLVLVALALAASGRALAAEPAARGSGRIATERRTVAGFDRVSISGSFQVEIHQGSVEALELSGDDNLLPLIETKIEGTPGAATLRIRPKDDLQLAPTQPLRLRIDVMHLSAIGLAGAGHVTAPGVHAARLGVSIGGTGSVELAGLEAGRLAIDIGGSGRVSADGHAGALAVNLGGSGECALSRLAVDEAQVSIGGSGKAEINAGKQLTVSIAGSGRVTHTGAAVPRVSIVGSGSVQPG